jgi:undecaprenyl phosphate-alpha-L-ara4FN deformylase
MTATEPPLRVGLRIDVDTLRGTRDGVPGLLKILQRHGTVGTFYFSVGPDNMGRHLWRLLKPTFFRKMLRSNAASLYGLDILLRGTFWPGPIIADKAGSAIIAAARSGHEIGFHAWDHHRWQTRVEQMSPQQMTESMRRGCDALAGLTGQTVTTTAVAGWRATEAALEVKQDLGFAYNSDCRGDSLFVPVVEGRELAPQVPVTLPTYDEIIGRHGLTDQYYNGAVLDAIRPGQLNVYTVHAEVEGIARAQLFDELLGSARARGIEFVPLQQLLQNVDTASLPRDRIQRRQLPGREGWVSWQASAA